MTFSPIPGPLTAYSRRAMASEFVVSFNEQDPGALAFSEALDEVDRIEQYLSIFISTSPVSRINQLAAEFPVRVDSEPFRYIHSCEHIGKLTEGLFDVTCTPLWDAWGFARRQGEVPSKEILEQSLECVGLHHVRFDTENNAVSFDRPGVSLNFGGVGKGMAVDRASEYLCQHNISNHLIHGGRSSAMARGGRKGDYTPRKKFPCWTVGLMNPLRPGVRLGEIHLVNQALATSGSQYQFFRHKGRRLSHIIDPRNGQPAEGILSTTVIAENATLADALSTAFFIMGSEKTSEFCQKSPEIGAILLLETRKSPGFEIRHYNLSEDTLSLSMMDER